MKIFIASDIIFFLLCLIVSREVTAYIIITCIFSFAMGAVIAWFRIFFENELMITRRFIINSVNRK